MKYEVVITRPGSTDRLISPFPQGSKEQLEDWVDQFNKHSQEGVHASVQERKDS